MLTPLDIQNKEFDKGFRGYKEIQVDSFLDEVIADYEFVFKENLELKSKIDMLNEQIRSFGSMEDTLQKTLVVAQNTADEIVRTARDKEESIIAQAERRANTITENATNQIIESQNEYEVLRKEIAMFRNKYKSLLNAQLDTIDHYCDDNVFSVLDDMKEKDFEFSNQTKPQVAQAQDQHKEQAASVEPQKSEYEQAYAQVQTDVQAEPEVSDNPFADSYEEESKDDSLGFYIESLENELNNNDDEIEDLSNNTKRPILD